MESKTRSNSIHEPEAAEFNGVFRSTSSDRQQSFSHPQPKLDPLTKKMLFSPYSRGVAVGNGKVFIGTVDGRGIALDQKTGKEIWQIQLTDFANCHGCNFTSRPVVAGDMLTFGSTAGELATQGKIYGVEAKSGKKVWEFNTIKEDPKSWPGESGKMRRWRCLDAGHLRSGDEYGFLRYRLRRPAALDCSIMNRIPHSHSGVSAREIDSLNGVSAYSTRGGTSLKSCRVTMPSASISFRCWISVFSLIPCTTRRNSPKRRASDRSAQRMSPFHSLPITSSAASSPQK
jgi:hypothetical protein